MIYSTIYFLFLIEKLKKKHKLINKDTVLSDWVKCFQSILIDLVYAFLDIMRLKMTPFHPHASSFQKLSQIKHLLRRISLIYFNYLKYEPLSVE